MSLAASQDVVMEEVQRAALSLIFNPDISRPIFKSASLLAGTIYPVYASFKALETPDDRDDIQWLTYWTICASFGVVEHYLEEYLNWIPYYFHAKLIFLLWLQLPVTKGAKKLYHNNMEPILKEYQPKIDRVLYYWYKRVGWVLDSPVTKAAYSQAEKVVGQGVNAVVWFVKDQTKGGDKGDTQTVTAESKHEGRIENGSDVTQVKAELKEADTA